MTERISRLEGIWIGAAISSTSHSNKAGSTTVNRARLTGKDQGRRPCCHNKHKIFLIGLHVMYLSFRDTSRNSKNETEYTVTTCENHVQVSLICLTRLILSKISFHFQYT